MSDDKALVSAAPGELTTTDLVHQVAKIQEVMRAVMRPGEHYGVIPGTTKPTLFKPGAEKLGFVFRLAAAYDVRQTDLPDGHREYHVTCTLRHIPSGTAVAQGLGMCSTRERNYRYRGESGYTILEEPIPVDAKDRKQEYRRQGLGMKKVDGTWCWVRYGEERAMENPDIADTYNTVLKMAKKRAHVDGILTACAASDIFTQDVEDAVEENQTEEDRSSPPAATARVDSEPSVSQEDASNTTSDLIHRLDDAVRARTVTESLRERWVEKLRAAAPHQLPAMATAIILLCGTTRSARKST